MLDTLAPPSELRRMTAMPPEEESRVQFVMRQVADHIGREGMKVGDQLPSETKFVEMLGVSRPVVREAFGALAALNIIDTGNGRRPRVSAMNGSVLASSLEHAVRTQQISVQEVWETRRILEIETIGLAALRRSDEEASRIAALAAAMAEAAPGSPELMRLDLALHKTIAHASRNGLMARIIASFEPLLETTIPVAWSKVQGDAHHAMMLERHRELAETIRRRDPEAARKAMDDHFDRAVGASLPTS